MKPCKENTFRICRKPVLKTEDKLTRSPRYFIQKKHAPLALNFLSYWSGYGLTNFTTIDHALDYLQGVLDVTLTSVAEVSIKRYGDQVAMSVNRF